MEVIFLILFFVFVYVGWEIVKIFFQGFMGFELFFYFLF